MMVDVRHPAPVSWVPPGRRKTVDALVSTVTAAELRVVPDSELRHVMDLGPRGLAGSLFEHGGSLWLRADVGWGERLRPVTPSEAASFLSLPDACGEDGNDAHVALLARMRMTPLVALDREGEATIPGRAKARRGEPEASLAGGRIVADGREAASRAAALHLAGEVLLTDTAVLTRYRPVAGLAYDLNLMGLSLRHLASPLPARVSPGSLPCRPDKATEATSDALGIRPCALNDGPLQAERRTLAGFDVDDEDLRVLANWLPCDLPRFLARRVRDPEHGTAVASLAERLRPLAIRGALGGIPTAEAPAALDAFRSILADTLGTTAFRAGSTHVVEQRDWESLASHLARSAGRLDPFEVSGEDLEALGGMGP